MTSAGSIFARMAEALEQDTWLSIARPAQLPPPGNWSTWLILAGRGFGKTRAGTEFVRAEVESGRAGRIALVASTMADLRDTVVEGPSGLLAISPKWNRPSYEPSKRRLTWPNGAIATAYSCEEPDRLRGPNHDLALCDELAAWTNLDVTWAMLQMTLRVGKNPRCVIATTPKPVKLIKELVSRSGADVAVVRGSTFDNRQNLSGSFIDSITRRYAGTRLGRQELNAELLEDVEGALWNRDLIEELRRDRSSVPNFQRVVVAIDPAISVGEDSDETGIIVAGLGTDQHGYVLQDASGKYLPQEWASKAVGLYHKYSADRIIGEINQGGVMVEQTIRAIDENVPFRGVHAKRGKLIRAEPVSAPILEDQLCSYDGSGDSPDRLDAMVYALLELMSAKQTTGIIDYYRELCEEDRQCALRAPPVIDAATVKLLPPPGGVSIVYGRSAMVYSPDNTGAFVVSPDDAIPLRQTGFVDAEL